MVVLEEFIFMLQIIYRLYMHVARVIYQLLNGYMDWRGSAFFLACCHGHILVAQWLYGFGGIDIYAVDDRAFACNGGHL
jgi:hypothetical protein